MNQQAQFIPDKQDEIPLSLTELKALATNNQALTFTCAPWGSGNRMGIDRDNDSVLDNDE